MLIRDFLYRFFTSLLFLFSLESFASSKPVCDNSFARSQLAGHRVYVFRHIQKRLWTVWAPNDKGILRKSFLSDRVLLLNADEFFVDERKRKLVIERAKRMPHAGIWGKLSLKDLEPPEDAIEVFYDPFTLDSFVDRFSQRKIQAAKAVYFTPNSGAWAIEPVFQD